MNSNKNKLNSKKKLAFLTNIKHNLNVKLLIKINFIANMKSN